MAEITETKLAENPEKEQEENLPEDTSSVETAQKKKKKKNKKKKATTETKEPESVVEKQDNKAGDTILSKSDTRLE